MLGEIAPFPIMSQSTVSCDGANGLKNQMLRPLAEKRGLEP